MSIKIINDAYRGSSRSHLRIFDIIMTVVSKDELQCYLVALKSRLIDTVKGSFGMNIFKRLQEVVDCLVLTIDH